MQGIAMFQELCLGGTDKTYSVSDLEPSTTTC